MWQELAQLGTELLADPTLRCLVVTGDGPSFSDGIDLVEGLARMMSDFAAQTGEGRSLDAGSSVAGTFNWIPKLSCPNIAAVQGHAYGAGLQLALACDFRIFAHNARVGLVETRYGIMSDMGATVHLPRIVGEARAREMILLGEVIDADEPELSRRVKDLFTAHKHHTMATLRKDGSPRISGTEVDFADDGLALGMLGGAMRAADLRRDQRVALHSCTADPDDDQASGPVTPRSPGSRPRSTRTAVLLFRIDSLSSSARSFSGESARPPTTSSSRLGISVTVSAGSNDGDPGPRRERFHSAVDPLGFRWPCGKSDGDVQATVGWRLDPEVCTVGFCDLGDHREAEAEPLRAGSSVRSGALKGLR